METEEHNWKSWLMTIAEGAAGVMAVQGGVPALQSVPDPGPARARRPLTQTEQRIIEHQGTEPPFSGDFVHFSGQGTYACRKCGHEIFRSDAKFDAGGGWPCFDEALPGAVKSIDENGARRMEAACARCGGHLGHIFAGEGLTPKNRRYCVNSLSLEFQADRQPANLPEREHAQPP